MKVKCLSNKGSFLPKDSLKPGSGFSEKTEFHLLVNKEYVVYGMTLYAGYIWYYLCDESYLYYPAWNPSPLFEVVDARLSKYWVFSFERGTDQSSTYTNIVYPEWARDPYYYDALTDGDEKEVEIFKKYKRLMDSEFPDTSVPLKDTVTITQDKTWFICPDCFASWESQASDGMVECPKCKKVLHNPLYSQEAK